MDDSTKKYMEIIFYTYIIRIICVVGVLGNTSILIVLSRRGAKGTAFVYIKALAGVDLLICIMLLGMGFIRCGDCISGPEQEFVGRVYEGFLYLPLANAGQMANLFITMAMAVHRAVSVRIDALRIDVRKSRTVAKSLVLLIVGFSFVVNGIRFFFFTIKETCDMGSELRFGSIGRVNNDPSVIPMSLIQSRANVEVYYAGAVTEFNDSYYLMLSTVTLSPQHSPSTIQEEYGSEMDHANNATGQSDIYGINTTPSPVRYTLEKTAFYERVIRGFLLALSTLHFIELLTLTTVNIILIRVLRRSKSQRNTLLRTELQHRKKRDDVTRMLVVTVVVHIVCHLHSPFSADPIAQLVFGPDYIKSNEYNIQLAVNNTLTLTSHAITFFLYLVCAKFRKQVKRTWECILGHLRIRRSSRSSTPTSGWTPSYSKGGASPILHRNHSLAVSARYL
ncbi:uncharacterized protein LOC129589377 [Paramacrobiotus metropolitanus]|uniref:uncharacterized protein LOC129589377 n=1 Tax=Paramacrobiotus metropolitanus TaxID=2943436 RepID=UPI00244579A4|nr:uncharacterized protein LOC129589377 [Paramacrobiotus metropolitanus]